MNSAESRSKLIYLSQGIVGNYSDAEDIVAEALFKLSRMEGIHSPEAWLSRVVVNQSLDFVRSARARREEYVGPWLPEAAAVQADVEDNAIRDWEVDLVLVRLLQMLTPVDRAVVILHDVGGFKHPEIASLLRCSAQSSRQRLSRAHRRLREASGDATGTARDEELVQKIHGYLNNGDLESMLDLLAKGVVLWTDSNGAQRAARNPIYGNERVARFIRGIILRYGMPQWTVVRIHGAWALRAVSDDMLRVIAFEVVSGRITGIQVQQNDAKIVGIPSRS